MLQDICGELSLEATMHVDRHQSEFHFGMPITTTIQVSLISPHLPDGRPQTSNNTWEPQPYAVLVSIEIGILDCSSSQSPLQDRLSSELYLILL
jgi:hypothetical protein